MKSVLLVGLFGALVSLGQAAKAVEAPGSPETRTDIQPGQERGDHHGGGGGGGHGHGGGGGHGHVQYHETHGQELFQGEEWMILLPLLLIPLVALVCWYLWGGSGGKAEEGWGWDRMGYSDNSVGGAYQQQGAYERSFVPADTMDKSTHQRIFNSIQQ